MEELSSNMLQLKVRITNAEKCVDLEMPDPNKEVGVDMRSMEPIHGEPVKQLEQNLHITLKSLEEVWCEQKKREQEKYDKLLGEYIKLKSEHDSVRLELCDSKQSEFYQQATILSDNARVRGSCFYNRNPGMLGLSIDKWYPFKTNCTFQWSLAKGHKHP